QQTADRLFDRSAPGDWNQAMMELGATLCAPRSPQCLLCPASPYCEGRKLGIAEQLPEARKKRDSVDVTLLSLVVVNSRGKTLLLPPPKQKNKEVQADHIPTLVANLWHFPTASTNGNWFEASSRAWKNTFTSKTPPPSEFLQLPP